MKYAIIGATGNVGRKTIEILEKSNLKVDKLNLLASKKSKGQFLSFRGKEIIVADLVCYSSHWWICGRRLHKGGMENGKWNKKNFG